MFRILENAFLFVLLGFSASVDGLEKSRCHPVTITYTVWIESNVTEIYNINITAPESTTFYKVMQLAMDKDAHFAFEATEWPYGHYITSIAGHKEDRTNNIYWLIYKLPELPDPARPPTDIFLTPVGVDELYIADGDHYLFWYRNL